MTRFYFLLLTLLLTAQPFFLHAGSDAPVKKCSSKNLPGIWYGEYEYSATGTIFMLVMEVETIKDCRVTGTLHWPDFFNCKSSFKGEIINNELVLEETTLLQGYNMEYFSTLRLALAPSDTLKGSWRNDEGLEVATSSLVKKNSLSEKHIQDYDNRIKLNAEKHGTALIGKKAETGQEEFLKSFRKHNEPGSFKSKPVILKGMATFGQINLPLYLAYLYPDYLYMELEFQNLKVLSGANPENSWQYDPMEDKVRFTLNSEEDSTENPAFGSKDLNQLLADGFTLETIHNAQLDSIDTYRILLKKEEQEVVFFVDKRNFQAVRKDQNYQIEYMFNHRKVHNYFMPTFYYKISQDETMTFRFTEINTPASIPDSIFYLPAHLENKVAKTSEKDSDYFHESGLDHFEAGEYEAAAENFTRAIKMNPAPLNYYLDRGNTRTKLGDFYGAISDFQTVLEYEPENAQALNSLGLAKYYLGDYEQAVQDFSKAIEADSNILMAYYNKGFSYIQLKEFEKAEPNFAHLIEQDSTENPEYDYYYAIVLSQLNKYDSAVNHYSIAISNGQQDADIYNRRGVVYYNAGKLEPAQADFEKAISMDEKDPVKFINLANLYADQQNYRKAIEVYSKALLVSEDKAEIYNRIGLSYYSLEDFDNAKEHFSKAIMENPKNATYYDNRASARNQLMDFSGAIEDFSTSLSLYPDDANIYLQRGLLHVQQHNKYEGCKDFLKAKELGLEEAQEMLNEHCTYQTVSE